MAAEARQAASLLRNAAPEGPWGSALLLLQGPSEAVS